MASSTNSMSAESILNFMSKSLPSTDSSRPIKDGYAAIALLCHACMLAAGFRLVGLGEDHKIEAESTPSDVQALPSEWDASSTYAFRYRHTRSAMEYLVKVTRLGNKAIIYGLAMGDDKTASFEIKVQDYTSEGSIQDSSGSEDSHINTRLKNILISNGRITDLTNKFRTEVIQKLAPGIQKEGYEETQTQTTTRNQQPLRPEAAPERDPLRDDQPQPARPRPFDDDPLAIHPRRSGPVPDFAPPGFEDEYEMNRPPGRGMFPAGGIGGQPFGNIGERDLYPPGLGPNDPLRMGPGGFRGGGGGGMHPTFDDPLFVGQGGQGGQRYDPRAPPGARYDPIGPGDGPPNLNRGGARFPGARGGGGGPPNPFGGFGGGDFI